eukprot:1416167-Amphidinium_carterae.1
MATGPCASTSLKTVVVKVDAFANRSTLVLLVSIKRMKSLGTSVCSYTMFAAMSNINHASQDVLCNNTSCD